MKFLKEHLIHDHYTWPADTTTLVFKGSPSRRLFDPYNGLQVLYIINTFAETSVDFTTAEGQKIEEAILNKLPIGSQSELSVYNWLRVALAS